MSSTANGTGHTRNEATLKGNETPLVIDMNLDTLRDLVQGAGYRVETVKEGQVTFLRSATNGLSFDIRPGNSFSTVGRFADVAFVALFAVRGTLPLDLVNRWNATRRFGRLFLDQPVPGQDFLVFCMDVSVAGGVTQQQLRNQIDLWDGLIQQLIPWLRDELGKIAPTIDTASSANAQAPLGPVSAPAQQSDAEAATA